jgi:t-SNARE complex subunit (syntaxin)
MVVIETNDNVLGSERARIRMLSDRLLFMRDETRRDDLREHLRSEIHQARRLRYEAVACASAALQA